MVNIMKVCGVEHIFVNYKLLYETIIRHPKKGIQINNIFWIKSLLSQTYILYIKQEPFEW